MLHPTRVDAAEAASYVCRGGSVSAGRRCLVWREEGAGSPAAAGAEWSAKGASGRLIVPILASRSGVVKYLTRADGRFLGGDGEKDEG
jgi:hypothetical protein